MVILTKVRQMPDNQKKVISLATAAVLTLVIVVVWFSFSSSSAGVKSSAEENSKLSSLSPMQVIKDEFSKAFEGFNDLPDSLGSTSITNVGIPIEVIGGATTSTSTINSTSTASTTLN